MSNQNFVVKNGLTVGVTDVIAANGAWIGPAIAGATGNANYFSVTTDNTSNTVVYPIWSLSTSGNVSAYVSNTKLSFNPATGDFKAPAVVANNGLLIHSDTMYDSYVVESGKNALVVGPFTVANSATMTLSAGQRFIVL